MHYFIPVKKALALKISSSQFLKNVPTPKVKIDKVEILDSPVTLEEINKAITGMQSGKSPGKDGFPVGFYKKKKIQ